MHITASRLLAVVFGLVVTFLAPRSAQAANVLLLCDSTADSGIAAVLTGDGHTVMTVTNDAGATSVLLGDLSAYDLIVWSGAGGAGHTAPAYTNVTSYVNGGGRVFYTGYDATFEGPAILALLGVTGSYDFPDAPGPIAMVSNAMTTGLVDIRGVTPTGGNGDLDGLTGLLSGTISIAVDSDPFFVGGHEWTLRTLGAGLVAYVSNGSFSGTHASWSVTTGSMGARAYNAVLRNFAYNAGGFSGACTGEDTACTGGMARPGICHTSRCCIGCWDGSRCFSGTGGATCGVAGGACISCSDGMACTLDVCTTGACSNPGAPAGTMCDDGMFCTTGETCNAAGTCGSGGPNGCLDATSCTVDTCDEGGDMCVHTPGGGCLIGAACQMSFTVNPANACEVCDPARNTMGWSPRTAGVPCGSTMCTGASGAATVVAVGMCDGASVCVLPAAMPCASGRCSGTTACNPACATGSCPAGSVCSTATMRCVTPAALGEVCAAGSECTSGFCADGVCCMTSCDQLCDSCDLPGTVGTCAPSPAGRSCGLSICTAGLVTAPGMCDAGGLCMRMGATSCPSGLCVDATTCNMNCSVASCPAGQICTAAMRCVTPAATGEVCTANDECVSGFCADGLCCGTACSDVCVSCDQAGREGLCTPYTAGGDPESECPVGSVCSGGRSCAPGMIDAGGIMTADAGAMADAGGVRDAGTGFDVGEILAPARRGCSCRAVGLSRSATTGTLLLGLGALGLLVASRRRR